MISVGHPAGEHLALWSAARHRLPEGSPWRRDDAAPIRGVVTLAGIADLDLAFRLKLGRGVVRKLLGGSHRNTRSVTR